jgi:hypothetical protein
MGRMNRIYIYIYMTRVCEQTITNHRVKR